ncbi:MAG: XTP/dITP diphosphatase [Dehalococcoidia bacterium]
MSKPKILLATNNRAKVREYDRLLKGIPYRIVSLEDVNISEQVEETGASFEENATLKAKRYAELSGLTTIADDSGLEVDALGGEPGVRSARYAGEGVSDKERIDFLLKKIVDVPWEKRQAKFRCVIAIAYPDGKVQTCHGQCNGILTFAPLGENGFGYDPIFYLPDLHKTMAELSMSEKNDVSHRGKATEEARKMLQR